MKRKRYISIALIIVVIFISITEYLICLPVFALSAGGLQTTIASVIISLMLQTGVAPVNQAWLTKLNNAYGVESPIGTIQDCINQGLLTQSGNTLIDTGLSSAIEASSAYTDLGLSDIFTTSVDDIGVVAASGGTNLANTAIHCGTLGTVGAFAGAVGVGIGAGILINHVREKFGKYITSQASLNTVNTIMDNITTKDSLYFVDVYGKYMIFPNSVGRTIGYYYTYNDNKFINLSINKKDNSENLYYDEYDATQNRWRRNVYLGGSWGTSNGSALTEEQLSQTESTIIGFHKVADSRGGNALVDSFRNSDDVANKISPDLIGSEGNQQGVYNPDTGDFVFPGIEQTVPEGYDMKPVDMNDYQNYADDARNNAEDGNINKPVQGEEFDNLIDTLLVEPSIIPDQGVTDPDVPDRPIIPEQPDIPAKDPITGEEQSEVLQGITTPDLRSVFPFCIPFDLYNIFGVFKSEGREAPVIVWEFEIFGKSYSVIVDLSPYEDVASLLRLLELVAFIVGLAVATRKLIGAGG